MIRADGSTGWTFSRAVPLLDGDGGILEWFGAATDVTARREAQEVQRMAEEAIREERRSLEILNRAGSALAVETDLHRLVQIVTDAGVGLAGAQFGAFFYNVQDDRGESCMLYTLSGAPADAFSKLPMPRNTEVFAPTFSGTGIVRSDDITRDARYGRNRQAQKMEAVGQLTGGVAHGFNNLLQVIVGNLELISRLVPAESGRIQRAAEHAMSGARQASSLTQRLLAFSRRQPLDPKPIDVNSLVGGMSDLLSRSLGETISIETVRAAGLWKVEVDPNALESAILNLENQARIDLLFTDVVLLGGMTGAQVAARSHELHPSLKVLFTTGYARNAIVHHGRLDKGVQLITKPFTFTELAAKVRDVLDGLPR